MATSILSKITATLDYRKCTQPFHHHEKEASKSISRSSRFLASASYSLRRTITSSFSSVLRFSEAFSHDQEKIITLLENQIADLKIHLEKSTAREESLIGALRVEQDKTAHMLTTSERRGWMRRLLGFGTG